MTPPTLGPGGPSEWATRGSGALSQLAGWFTAALRTLKQKLVAQVLCPVEECTTGFGSYLRTKYDEYGHAIHEANIKAE